MAHPPNHQGPMPTKSGDILILFTEQTFTIHIVGVVSADGQQDLSGDVDQSKAIQAGTLAAALAAARLIRPEGRSNFFQNIDTGEWSEL